MDARVFERTTLQEQEYLARAAQFGTDLKGVAWQRGFYAWHCPACSEPLGPFKTQDAAEQAVVAQDAQEQGEA